MEVRFRLTSIAVDVLAFKKQFQEVTFNADKTIQTDSDMNGQTGIHREGYLLESSSELIARDIYTIFNKI